MAVVVVVVVAVVVAVVPVVVVVVVVAVVLVVTSTFSNAVQPLTTMKLQALANSTVVSPVSSGESLMVKPLRPANALQCALAASTVIEFFSRSTTVLGMNPPVWITTSAGDGFWNAVRPLAR